MVPFSEASYLAQVRRLQLLATEACAKFPIRVSSLRFIHHGENATFDVTTKNRERYLMRIHRSGYHSDGAIEEELRWLEQLSKEGLFVPRPMRSLKKKRFEIVGSPLVDSDRRCSLLSWTHGSQIEKSLSPTHLFKVGKVIGNLQLHQPKFPVRYRRYWTPDGLVGNAPKLGPVDEIPGATDRQMQIIEHARKTVLRALNEYCRRHPRRTGMIHADLHFGNVIRSPYGLAAIDFDDCGVGPFMYDLVMPWLSAMNSTQDKKKLSEMKSALFSGYEEIRSVDDKDREIFEHLVAARRIAMLGWLVSRSDNPRLRAHLKTALKRATSYLRKQYGT